MADFQAALQAGMAEAMARFLDQHTPCFAAPATARLNALGGSPAPQDPNALPGSDPAGRDVATINDMQPYRMANAGFERLNETMCADNVNGGDLNNPLLMQPCGNYAGQMGYFTQKVTELRHLPTFTMATEFRGRDMCLTIDGTLIDHALRLATCDDARLPNQFWIVLPAENGPAPNGDNGWQITPFLDPFENDEDGFSLVVSPPPMGTACPVSISSTLWAIALFGVWSLGSRPFKPGRHKGLARSGPFAAVVRPARADGPQAPGPSVSKPAVPLSG